MVCVCVYVDSELSRHVRAHRLNCVSMINRKRVVAVTMGSATKPRWLRSNWCEPPLNMSLVALPMIHDPYHCQTQTCCIFEHTRGNTMRRNFGNIQNTAIAHKPSDDGCEQSMRPPLGAVPL